MAVPVLCSPNLRLVVSMTPTERRVAIEQILNLLPLELSGRDEMGGNEVRARTCDRLCALFEAEIGRVEQMRKRAESNLELSQRELEDQAKHRPSLDPQTDWDSSWRMFLDTHTYPLGWVGLVLTWTSMLFSGITLVVLLLRWMVTP